MSRTLRKKVGIVGKGLLFDTGGYNIKTAMMELMKFDCGGSAAGKFYSFIDHYLNSSVCDCIIK